MKAPSPKPSPEVNWWRRTIIVAVIGFALGIGIAACGSSKPPPPAHNSVPKGTAGGFTSRARSQITTGDGLRLKQTKFEKSYGGQDYSYITVCPGWSGVPDQVSDNSSPSFCYESYHESVEFKNYDTGFYFYMDILVPNGSGGWMPSGYYVDAAAKVALFGDPVIDCTIKKSGSTAPANGAPFHCDKSFEGSGNDAQPRWKVTANPLQVVDATDSSQVQKASDLIVANCTATDTPKCIWTRTQNSSVFAPDRKQWIPLTDWSDSCPPGVDEKHLTVLTFDSSVDISWTDKVGGKVSAQADIGKLIKGSVEVHYEHAVAQKDTWKKGIKYTIPFNLRGAIYLQHGMITTTGDFYITTDNGDRYLVKKGEFTFPLDADVQVEGKGQTVLRGYDKIVTTPCSQQAPAKGAPPPANATVH